ncbi:ATPase [Candidatus Woesearchaeota archaeon CG07_land_8_20_14_0_80_44_23]|nr:MAG: ATPase [Candidatus Woesearchaeota archaeon CG07_land_8_20_14_0_80_44_23]
MPEEIKPKVAEAQQEDVNKGIIRIDAESRKILNLKPGDAVEIQGGRRTVAIVDRAYPGDEGLGVVRIDGITRRNAQTSIGEIVKISKADVKEAKKVVLAPAKKDMYIRPSSPNIFKEGLLGRYVMKGDIVIPGGTKARRMILSQSDTFSDVSEALRQLNDFSAFNFGFGNINLMVVDTLPKKNAVIITDLTEVQFNPQAVEVAEERISEVSYEDIGGLSDEIRKVREMVELPLKHPEIFERLGIEPPKGVLLHGPPGTGKTLLAKAVANETNSHFVLINGPEIMSKYYGQSEENLRKKFEDAEKNAPSIIFIDEIDAIASKREESKGEVERRVVAQLLAVMDGLKSRGKVVVIAATNVPNLIDPALRRPGRFDREIEINVPHTDARLEILKIHTRNMPLAKDVNLKEIAEVTHGFVGADLESLAKEAAMIVLRGVIPDLKIKEDEPLPEDVLKKLVVRESDFKDALKVVRPSAMREVMVEIPKVKWDDVGGMEEMKQELKEAVEWPIKNPEAFKRMGIRPPRGILLYGAPGTGKTMLAKAVANESQANFIPVKGPELLSKWVGESEKAVREIFKKARQNAPAIVFFDEVDSMTPRRGSSSDSQVTDRILNQLLTEMDGLEELHDVVVIAATNRPDMVDPALLRPGRFDRIILTGVPDENARLAIFKIHTKGMPLKDVNIKDLAKKTEGYVGSDIEAVCREAAILSLRADIKAKEVTKKEFSAAVKKVPPSVNPDIVRAYAAFKDSMKSAYIKDKQKQKEEKPGYFG